MKGATAPVLSDLSPLLAQNTNVLTYCIASKPPPVLFFASSSYSFFPQHGRPAFRYERIIALVSLLANQKPQTLNTLYWIYLQTPSDKEITFLKSLLLANARQTGV